MKEFMKNWDWLNAWLGLLFISAIALLLLVGYATVQDHTLRGYYLYKSETSGVCVISDYPWEPDDKAFCTDDINRALDVLKRLNEGLGKK